MKNAKKNAFGQGPYSKTKYVFTTLEQYVSAVAKFYDEVSGSSREVRVACGVVD